MLNQVEKAQQKWAGVHTTVDLWLQERQALLVQYCKLAGLPPFLHNEHALPDVDAVREFCELLMDYVSAGHFEVYDKLVVQTTPQAERLTESLYPRIADTTDTALRFHDHFADLDGDAGLEGFDQQLTVLGEALEERFAMEDQLINLWHTETVE
ncbi:sigma D regulator [Aestuariibacter halophilus]|uniref:Sigma D regulator n=1 Tax=Fluctibacter halophilus TaxID=226011 RepID=A0ABS8GES1_9ALTE|nr:sigma D regulator [Aestuariibacter halophilus]MCC2617701.1 sigma D regulator [Aestuariibacter halophilus]